MSFPRYPEYKESGIDWIGSIPADWETTRLKNAISVIMGQSPSSEDCNQDGQGTPFLQGNAEFGTTFPIAKQFCASAKKHSRKGDLLFSVRAPVGALNVSDRSYAIGRGLCALRADISDTLSFIWWFLPAAKQYFESISTGSTFEAVSAEQVGNLPLVMPLSRREQAEVARFLDHETAKIDALIREQECLIELLQEKRHGLVLSSYHSDEWREIRLKNAVVKTERPVCQKDDEEYVALGVFNRGRGLFHKAPKENQDMGDSDFFWVESGDLILSGQFAWEGSVALAGEKESGTVVSHRYPIIRGKEGLVLTEYIYALLTTSHGDFLLNENSRGAAGRNRPLNIGALLKEKIKIPPMPLQAQIAELVHREITIRKEAEKQRELLSERRSALISAVVTGKIDVRNWQPPVDESAFDEEVRQAGMEARA